MERFVIEGGHALRGTIAVSGAKNAALPVLSAALLVDGPVEIRNVPDLRDVHTMLKMLRTLGAQVEFRDNRATVNAARDQPECIHR